MRPTSNASETNESLTHIRDLLSPPRVAPLSVAIFVSEPNVKGSKDPNVKDFWDSNTGFEIEIQYFFQIWWVPFFCEQKGWVHGNLAKIHYIKIWNEEKYKNYDKFR